MNKAPSAVSVRHFDSPIQAHFILNDGERSQQHIVVETDADGKETEYVCIGFEHVAKILAAHMVRIEKPKNDLDKACALEAMDAICGLLGSLGVITNLPKIRNELCPDCHGLTSPAIEIIKADVVAMAEKFGASQGKHPVT